MAQDKWESLGCLLGIAFLAFGGFQVYAAAIGLDAAIGAFWAGVAIVAAFVLRTSLPIMIGAFLCAKNIWEWHWMGAVLFAAPSLAFIIPSMAADLIGRMRGRY